MVNVQYRIYALFEFWRNQCTKKESTNSNMVGRLYKKGIQFGQLFMHHSLLKCHGHVKTLDDFFVVVVSARIICMMRGHIKLVFCFAKN